MGESLLSRSIHVLAFLLLGIGVSIGGALLVLWWVCDLLPRKLQGAPVFFGLFLCLALGLIAFHFFFATVRRSNWLLRICPEGLLIKVRSDLNAWLPEPHPVVVNIPFDEIAWLRKTREQVSLHTLTVEDGPYAYRAWLLDLKLTLNKKTLDELRQAIEAEIHYRIEEGTSGTLTHHYPVFLEGDVLRIQWWKPLRPDLDSLLETLQQRVTVEPSLDLDSDYTTLPSAEELDREILELIHRGETVAAIGLARRFQAISLADATEYVKRFDG